MGNEPFSLLSLKIGAVLVSKKDAEYRTCDISRCVQINRGSAHRVLADFQQKGWLDREKLTYRLTESGIQAMLDALRPFQIAPLST